MTSMHGGDIAVIGAAETDELGVLPDISMIELHAQAALNALRDAGVRPADVDGLATAGPLGIEVAHHLGLTPRWVDGTSVGGSSFLLHVRHAAAAIAAGAADVVLITHGESGRSGTGARAYAPQSRLADRAVRGARTAPSRRTRRSPFPRCASCTTAGWTRPTSPRSSSRSGSGPAGTRARCAGTR